MDEGEKSSMANAVAEAIPLRVVLMPLTLPSLVGGEEEEAMVHEDDCYEFIDIDSEAHRMRPPPATTASCVGTY